MFLHARYFPCMTKTKKGKYLPYKMWTALLDVYGIRHKKDSAYILQLAVLFKTRNAHMLTDDKDKGENGRNKFFICQVNKHEKKHTKKNVRRQNVHKWKSQSNIFIYVSKDKRNCSAVISILFEAWGERKSGSFYALFLPQRMI